MYANCRNSTFRKNIQHFSRIIFQSISFFFSFLFYFLYVSRAFYWLVSAICAKPRLLINLNVRLVNMTVRCSQSFLIFYQHYLFDIFVYICILYMYNCEGEYFVILQSCTPTPRSSRVDERMTIRKGEIRVPQEDGSINEYLSFAY